MKTTSKTVALFLVLFSVSSFAKENYIKQQMSKPYDLTVLDILIQKSTLADVKAHLGEAEIIKNEEADGSSICYLSDNKTGVRFNAGKKGDDKITDITLFKVSKRNTAGCATSPQVTGEIQNKKALKVGMSKESVLKILGPNPTETILNRVQYVYSYNYKRAKPKKGSTCMDINETGSYSLKYKADVVEEIKISMIESC